VATRPEILDNLPDGRSHADGPAFLATGAEVPLVSFERSLELLAGERDIARFPPAAQATGRRRSSRRRTSPAPACTRTSSSGSRTTARGEHALAWFDGLSAGAHDFEDELRDLLFPAVASSTLDRLAE
jgi:hypothetical protein